MKIAYILSGKGFEREGEQMIKYFCNRCEKELKGNDLYRVEIKVCGYTSITDKYSVHFCADCLAKTVGNEIYHEIVMKNTERSQRIAERKAKNAKIEESEEQDNC